MKNYTLIVSLLLLIADIHAQTDISDPVPDPLASGGIGVQVNEIADISGGDPRLNMLKESPDGTGRLFVIDQEGFLYVILPTGGSQTYLNFNSELGSKFLQDNSQNGSTSFAFHPEFETNGKFYVICSAPTSSGTPDFLAKRPINPSPSGTISRDPPFHDVLYEFTANDPSSNTFSGNNREIIRIEQPYDDHNFGEVTFNPTAISGNEDYGLLYAAIADGGNKFPISDADPENNGQDTNTIHGTIIRIDPLGNNSANGEYGIPSTNPFADGNNGLPEIWSYGHRNHHRLSWDTKNGDLYAFEMGQAMIEEVNRIIRGGNYGWGDREGTYLINEFDELDLEPIPSFENEGEFQYPVLQYDHPTDSGAIAGGAIYRGTQIPSLYGKLIFADFTGNREVFYGYVSDFDSLEYGTAAPHYDLDIYSGSGRFVDLATALSTSNRTDLRIGTDLSGEIYFMNKRNGKVHKLVASPNEPAFEISFSTRSVNELGGTFVLDVQTVDNFDWEIELNDDWISSESGLALSGSQTLNLIIDPLPNELINRQTSVVVAGRSFIIYQRDSNFTPWADIFPNATTIEEFYFDTHSLGLFQFMDWPWIYNFELNTWIYISEEGSNDSHLWMNIPK